MQARCRDWAIDWPTHGAKKRQQAAPAGTKQQAASSGHWSRGSAPRRPCNGLLLDVDSSTCTETSPHVPVRNPSRYRHRYEPLPPMRPRNKCALVRAGAHVFFTHMATTTDPLVGFRCSFVLWASGSGLQARCRDWAVDWPTHGARKRQQAATAKQQARQQAAGTGAAVSTMAPVQRAPARCGLKHVHRDLTARACAKSLAVSAPLRAATPR